ncbi:MAG: hypothetical protein IKC39_04155 [Clostridia bacterium]|nr:hypothetical protein [Clostridia bacterium]
MKINANNIRRIAMMLGLVMMLAVVLSACVNTDDVPEIMDTSFVEDTSEVMDDTSEERDLTTEPGHTDAPIVTNVINITPDTVAISGTCEEGAVIRVKGGEEEVTANSRDGYFIIETKLPYKNNLLQITAKVEGEEESKVWEEIARFNATADTRLDGNSVSVGVDSLLYLDKTVGDANGDNVYTESQLTAIKNLVSDNITAYINRSSGKEVEMIYVLIPNSTSIYSDVYPEGLIEKPATTVYDQVLNTLNKTRATVVDMRAIFNNVAKDEAVINKGGLYRVTDSSLSHYGAYLTYAEVMKAVSTRFPEAAAKAEGDFDWKNVKALGGDLVKYRELDKNIITEEIVVSLPKFMEDEALATINTVVKYNDTEKNDYSYYTDVREDEITGVAERFVTETKRDNLPDAIIYRDYSSLPFSDILAERFNNVVMESAGNFTFDATSVVQYSPDYVIFVLSEDNMDTAFGIN